MPADATSALPGGDLNASVAWFGLCCSTLQVYFHFSGDSDMAIGLGRMLGFHFPENFDLPYTARSVTEFWLRWHLSLSSWSRDSLYIPLGGNRLGATRTYANLARVFLVCGTARAGHSPCGDSSTAPSSSAERAGLLTRLLGMHRAWSLAYLAVLLRPTSHYRVVDFADTETLRVLLVAIAGAGRWWRPHLPSAVVLHDSFASPLMPYWSEHFDRVIYLYTTGAIDFESVKRETPDLVLLVQQEKKLAFAPDEDRDHPEIARSAEMP